MQNKSKNINNVLASLSIEKLYPSDFSIELLSLYENGEISGDECIEKIKQYYLKTLKLKERRK